jgi:hypothetical protein
MLMGTSTQESGGMTKLTGLDAISMLTSRVTKGSGSSIGNTESALKVGKMGPNT